ncbi:MAG: HPF/RaiA family ribosome-associated protein [Nocardioides sp.]|nr:HPF/RaiA family ribosome-associated protein [Nocardioides sp.]
MKIQVNTDKNVEGSAALSERTEADLASALTRFKDRLTRVEVHLRNESAGRTTGDDVRCLIEARPAGMDPVAVTHHAATLDEALRGATDKLEALLTSKFERGEGKETRETIRGR